jgi:hypothetical protein
VEFEVLCSKDEKPDQEAYLADTFGLFSKDTIKITPIYMKKIESLQIRLNLWISEHSMKLFKFNYFPLAESNCFTFEGSYTPIN